MVNRSSVEEKKSTVRSHQVLECYYMTSGRPCCFAENFLMKKKMIVNRIEIALT